MNIKEWLIRQRLRVARGKAYMIDIWNLFIFAGTLKILFPSLDYTRLVAISIILTLGWAILGYVDEKRLKMWQYENVYSAKNMNPFFRDMKEKVDELANNKEKKNASS